MPTSIAEAYLLILRSSMVPVIGEAIPTPFQGQIDIATWHWELKYDEQGAAGASADASASDESEDKGPTKSVFNGVDLIKAVQRMQESGSYPRQEDRDRKVRELIKKASDAQSAADKKAAGDGSSTKGGDGGRKLTFTFEKNVDLASTQLLNSMKAGERMPRAVLTLFHRSTNAPVTLIVTFGNVLLTNYSLSVSPEETMAELKESWTAKYETVDYVYQNRPAASGPNGITKGTARVFKMKLKSLF